MTDPLKQAAMQQALNLIERLNAHGWILADFEKEVYASIAALKAALEQQPEQEPVTCRFCHSKKGCWTWQCYTCGEIDDVQKPAAAQPVQEPVGEVTEVSDNGFRCEFSQRLAVGTKLYIAPPLPVQEPAHGDIRALKHRIHELEGELIGYKRLLQEAETAPPPEQEPVAYYHPHKGFYWAKPTHISAPTVVDMPPVPFYTTQPASQRPWVGLTKQDMPSGEDPMFDHQYFCAGMVYAAKVLQKKNK
jgi:hypothetical protein